MGDTFSTTKQILAREAEEKAKKDAEEEEKQKQRKAKESPEDNRLAWQTHFSMQQVVALHNAFKDQATKSPDPNEITAEQFEQILAAHGIEKGNCMPYLERLFQVFDNNESGTINFNEFILAMSVVTRGSAAEKFKLSFDIYDLDKTGSIDKAEMRQILLKLHGFAVEHGKDSGEQPAEVDVNKLVDEIFAVGDQTGNGELTYPEYFKACQKMPWLTSFDVPE